MEYDFVRYNCWNFVSDYMKEKYGKIVPEYSAGLIKSEIVNLVESEKNKFIEIKIENIENGDLVVIRLLNGWMHIGVYENGKIRHMLPKKGIVLEPMSRYTGRIQGVYRC